MDFSICQGSGPQGHLLDVSSDTREGFLLLGEAVHADVALNAPACSAGQQEPSL